MENKKIMGFLLRTKDKKLLKFYLKENIGIICEDITNNTIISNKIIVKKCLKYFYVFEDYNRNIILVYQDLIGNITFAILNEGKLKYSTIFYIKHNFITPINFKSVLLKDSSFYFYTLDSDLTSVYFRNNINSQSLIIYKEKNDIDINYKILYDKDHISLIILSTSLNMFKIILKTYNLKNRNWENNRVISISNHKYIDSSFFITNNKIHSLFIINEERKKSLIYKFNYLEKDQYKEREFSVCEDEDLSSCLIFEIDKIIYLLWISKNKIYGCYSLDFGESFSKTLIYADNMDECIRKAEFIDDGKIKEIYVSERNGNITLFLEELLKYNYSFNIDY